MRNRLKLSDANLEIMKAVWNKGGEATINNVLEAVNASRINKVKRATVQVQMRRLEAYGWLTHRSHDRQFLYAALRKEDEVKRLMLDHVRARLFKGSTAELVKCLFETEGMTPQDLRRIREIIDRKPEKRK